MHVEAKVSYVHHRRKEQSCIPASIPPSPTDTVGTCLPKQNIPASYAPPARPANRTLAVADSTCCASCSASLGLRAPNRRSALIRTQLRRRPPNSNSVHPARRHPPVPGCPSPQHPPGAGKCGTRERGRCDRETGPEARATVRSARVFPLPHTPSAGPAFVCRRARRGERPRRVHPQLTSCSLR